MAHWLPARQPAFPPGNSALRYTPCCPAIPCPVLLPKRSTWPKSSAKARSGGAPSERALAEDFGQVERLGRSTGHGIAGQQGVYLSAEFPGGKAGCLAGSQCAIYRVARVAFKAEISRQVVLPGTSGEQSECGHGGVAILRSEEHSLN